jgi:hypothetical protein
MEQWRRVLPVPVLEVEHGETVAVLEGVARRLAAFCSLDWEPSPPDSSRSHRPGAWSARREMR